MQLSSTGAAAMQPWLKNVPTPWKSLFGCIPTTGYSTGTGIGLGPRHLHFTHYFYCEINIEFTVGWLVRSSVHPSPKKKEKHPKQNLRWGIVACLDVIISRLDWFCISALSEKQGCLPEMNCFQTLEESSPSGSCPVTDLNTARLILYIAKHLLQLVECHICTTTLKPRNPQQS